MTSLDRHPEEPGQGEYNQVVPITFHITTGITSEYGPIEISGV